MLLAHGEGHVDEEGARSAAARDHGRRARPRMRARALATPARFSLALRSEPPMYQPLVPCPRCERHIKTTEPACPFCGAVPPSDLAARAIAGPTQRLSRAAAFVFGASLTVAGCGGE